MGAQRSEGGRDWQEQEEAENPEKITRPWNLMIKHRHIHKRGRRSLSAVSYTDPHVSMDLLRAVLQPSFNNDIMAVFMKYQKFYEKAAENVKENVGMEVQTDHLIREAYRNALEHAKQLFPENEVKTAGPGVSMKRLPKASDEEGSQRGSSFPRKRKSRPTVAFSDRPTTYIPVKPKIEAIRREGPKWDPSRLSETTTFVLGSRANKALGMGGTRGRIYIKHADLFKYAADSKDKQWLAERHHMRATGGKMAYLLVEEDIQELSCSDEYRESPEVRMDELKPFTVPIWMVEKMQQAMEVQKNVDP
ncbi:deoxynucleotidyltransferase terminal-interacting protein 1 isoform X1 [Oryzias latipes]|uniref:deoxynucleotidyltransferase terminal-interacting protein 1 isoform X1 n=1 Tax=Oryzias latipes TaxID=8090 RepID=UPI0000E9CF5D|nr:deoxynucleotidyltransferase terminal-interacting protein 1 isoform X1 [Oryzias latipes]